MTDLYSRRSFLAGVLAAGTLSTTATYALTRRSPVRLTLATGADPTGARDLLIDMWNMQHPDITLVAEVINSSTQDQYAKFTQTRADIFNLDVIHIRRFIDAGLIAPISPQNEISLLTPLKQACQVAGSADDYWAVPFNADVGMLFRRITDKRAIDEPPTLKEALAAGGRRLVGQLDTGGAQTDEAYVVNVLEQALAQDDAILGEDGTVSFSLGQWRTALAPLAEAIRTRQVWTEAGEDSATATYSRQNLRYLRNWPVTYRSLDRSERLKPETAEIRVGPLPVGILGGQSLAVAKDTEHRREAEQAIHFLTDTSAQKLLTTFGFAPTGLDAYIDPVLETSTPHLKAIRNAVDQSRPRPAHSNYAAFAKTFKDHTYAYLYHGEQLAQRFIQDMQEALR
jgi:multiple sugar transport system substrate-binding protein